jgi:outer membrane immunogenic protein
MMRRVSLTLLAATAIGVIACQAASAADLARKAPPPAPLAAPFQDWSGFYVGGEFGFGWGHQDTTTINGRDVGPCSTIFEGDGDASCADLEAGVAALGIPGVSVGPHRNGWLGGFFFGAQKQWNNWVLGLEGDIDGANIKSSGSAFATATSGSVETEDLLNVSHSLTVDSKIDLLGSVRGKVGWVPAPNWLLYGTGGLAFGHVSSNFTDTQSAIISGDAEDNVSAASRTVTGSRNAALFGWAAGAGVDWKFQIDQGSAWVLGVEYLHYQFLNSSSFNSDTLGFDIGKQSVDTVKGRISYLFSIH